MPDKDLIRGEAKDIKKNQPCMRYKIMVKGIKVVVKDRRLFYDLMSAAFSRCNDVRILLGKSR